RTIDYFIILYFVIFRTSFIEALLYYRHIFKSILKSALKLGVIFMALKESKLHHFNSDDSLTKSSIERARVAAEHYNQLDQASIDSIVQHMTLAGIQRHMELAKLELEETKRGIYEDKIVMNMHATESLYHSIKYMKTVGEVENNH